MLYIFFLLLTPTIQQDVRLVLTNGNSFPVISEGQLQPNFTYKDQKLDCSRPEVYLYEQTSQQLQDNTPYFLNITGYNQSFLITVSAEDLDFNLSVTPNICTSNCVLSLTNNCPKDEKYQFNTYTVYLGDLASFTYMVNCNSSIPFKPFEWGLFLLILLSSFVITISSFFSRAWSYGGYGIEINYLFVTVFNIIFVVGGILVYFDVSFLQLIINIFTSILGLAAVTVCASEFIFMCRWRPINNKKFLKYFRPLDLISFFTAVIIITLYWLLGQNWIVTDIISISTVIACIKMFKFTSLKMAVVFLGTVLLIQIIFSLLIHFQLEVSYNNLIINRYDSPIMAELPSITPELYRKCAWLPATSLILPGLLLSYLRRFDVSRSTHLYIFIGCLSFYLGSLCWMLVDQTTIHSLPFAILSEPITILLVIMFSYRRNEIRTLWNGYFYDPELNFLQDRLVVDRSESDHLTELVADLKIREDI